MAYDDIKIEILTKFIYPGMILKGNGLDSQGIIYIPRDTPVTPAMIEKLRQDKVESITYSRPRLKLKVQAEKTMLSEPVIENALSILEEIYGALASQKQYIPARQLGDVISDMVNDMHNNLDAVLNLVDLESLDDYSYTHSLNVASLSISLGSSLGLDHSRLKMLGLAGLLHDIGKSLIPREILNKPGKLDQQEWEIIQKHPVYSYNLLKAAGDFDINVLNAVLLHHENYDKGGYPFNKPEMKNNQFSHIIAVADVFDAMTSQQPYKEARTYDQAFGVLMQNSGRKFSPRITQVFLSEMSRKLSGSPIYPVNCYVLLNTGEIGYVVDHRVSPFSLRPIVNIFFNSKRAEPFYRLVQQIDLEKDNERFVVRKLTEEKYIQAFNQRLGIESPQ